MNRIPTHNSPPKPRCARLCGCYPFGRHGVRKHRALGDQFSATRSELADYGTSSLSRLSSTHVRARCSRGAHKHHAPRNKESMLWCFGYRSGTFCSNLDLTPGYPDLSPRFQSVATELQAPTNFNSILGYYRGNIIWTDAVSYFLCCATVWIEFNVTRFQNTVEDIYNLMSLKDVTTWKDLIYQTRIGQMGLTHLGLWDFFFNGSFDDAGVSCYLNVNDLRRPNEGRLMHTVGAALVYPHPRFHRIGGRELREI